MSQARHRARRRVPLAVRAGPWRGVGQLDAEGQAAGGRARPLPAGPQRQPDPGRHPARQTTAASSRLNAIHNFNPSWYATANLGWVSDTHYLEDFSNSLYGVSSYFLRSEAGLFGRGEHWSATLMADHYQLADYTLTDANLPFDRLPRALVHWAQPFGRWLAGGHRCRSGALRPRGVRCRQPPRRQALRRHAAGGRQLVRAAQARLALHRLPADGSAIDAPRFAALRRTLTPDWRQFSDTPEPQPADHLGRCRPVYFDRDTEHPRRPLPAYAGTAAVLPERAVPRPGRRCRCSTPAR